MKAKETMILTPKKSMIDAIGLFIALWYVGFKTGNGYVIIGKDTYPVRHCGVLLEY